MSDIDLGNVGTWLGLIAALAIGGVLVLVILWAAARRSPARTPSTMRAPPDDPRWSREGDAQRVGRACVVCGEIVRMESEAAPCDACGKICHHRCLARHQGSDHAPAKGPFRGPGG